MSTGRQLRDKALAFLEAKRHDWISRARLEAIFIAKTKGSVTINDVREAIQMPEDFHPNTWGAVLKSKDFEAIGFSQASHPAAHARVVRVFKLRSQEA
jgi:hypothetical protein